MALMPKVGDHIRFNGWSSLKGTNSPGVERWTGVVIEIIKQEKHNRYMVQRDFDGEVVSMISSSFTEYLNF